MTHDRSIKRSPVLVGAALLAAASLALAQPKFGNPSPTAGSETSQKANASADQGMPRHPVGELAGRRVQRPQDPRAAPMRCGVDVLGLGIDDQVLHLHIGKSVAERRPAG